MSLEFEYSTTRVRGMRSKLLSATRLRQLLEVKSTSEMIQLLEETDYNEDFVAQSTKFSGMELIMRALHENFKHTLQKLVRINPEEGQKALKLLLQEYEIQNISTIISAKAGDLTITDSDLMVVGKDEKREVEKLLLAKNVPDILKKMHKTEYGQALRKIEAQYLKTGDFRILTRALGIYYFEKLHRLSPGREDLLWKLLALKYGVRNLMIILRVKKSNPKADAIGYLPSKEDRFLKELSRMDDFGKIMQRVAQKRPHLASAVEECQKQNSLIPLEIALEGEFIEEILNLLKFAMLDFAAILGYLYLKELEVAAIRKIAYAKQYGFTGELKGMIFSFNAG
ncbi:MAG: V-type ATPase subunit [Candidatus Micrarchaeota archaeon]